MLYDSSFGPVVLEVCVVNVMVVAIQKNEFPITICCKPHEQPENTV
jgi:hypothetical protein